MEHGVWRAKTEQESGSDSGRDRVKCGNLDGEQGGKRKMESVEWSREWMEWRVKEGVWRVEKGEWRVECLCRVFLCHVWRTSCT